MILGGGAVLIPFIEAAHRHGFHVITVDYLPNNKAHKYSDEYHNLNISSPHKDEVLQLARKLKIDGISSFACDAGAISAAYVAENMSLPYQCTYETALVLQDKSHFRDFLTKNKFNVPTAIGYSNPDDCKNDLSKFHWPIIVKPLDSAGSKGVTKVNTVAELPNAVDVALASSIKNGYILEDFIEAKDFSSGAECFFVDGELAYIAIYDQVFDPKSDNRFVPTGERWPTKTQTHYIDELKSELQRLSKLLDLRTGLFNVEFRVSKDDTLYLMEVTPRAGGNGLADMLGYAADIDLLEAELRSSMGIVFNVHEPNFKKGVYQIYVLHSRLSGTYNKLVISNELKHHLIKESMWIDKGDEVHALTGGNHSIGTLFLKFDNDTEADDFVANSEQYVTIDLN